MSRMERFVYPQVDAVTLQIAQYFLWEPGEATIDLILKLFKVSLAFFR